MSKRRTFITGAIAGAGMVYLLDPERGQARREQVRELAGSIGQKMGPVVKAASDKTAVGIAALAARHSRIKLRTRVTSSAAPDVVWERLSNYQNFPEFLPHLREVLPVGGGHTRWVAEGPEGDSVEWEAVTLEWLPRERIAWRSVQGSLVDASGVIHFRATPEGGTDVDIQMAYASPGWTRGNAMASKPGSDLRQSLEVDETQLEALLAGARTPDATQGIVSAHPVSRTLTTSGGEIDHAAPTG